MAKRKGSECGGKGWYESFKPKVKPINAMMSKQIDKWLAQQKEARICV